jgi:hypothetical protein
VGISIQKTNNDKKEIAEQETSQDTERKAFATYVFDILPLEKSGSYPTISIENTKTGELIDVEVHQLSVSVQTGLLPIIGKLLAGTLMIFITTYIPVQTFKIVRSISKNVIFDMKNIKRIRNIGYSLIILFFVILLFQYLFSIAMNDMIAFKGYKISGIEIKHTSYLLFGLASLLFAEILKISLKMKEEQDFTI